MKKICKKLFFYKLKNMSGIWFHIAGFICLIWFLFRVLPKPFRSQYPCQQLAIPIAFGYIAFWTAMVSGLFVWMRRFKTKTISITPAILMVFILMFSISGFGFADTFISNSLAYEPWDPIPKQPIGVPTGLYPGRVVWVWNPDATQRDMDGYFWQEHNNNLTVINQMFSSGLRSLTNAKCDLSAWEYLFRYYNREHGKGDIGYQSGEKVAIKINLNNCWNPITSIDDYEREDNERDAHPQVMIALLMQLTNAAGVQQSDITVYDSSRKMANWFYDIVVELFPDVNYIDMAGEAEGRIKAQESDVSFYYSDGLIRTLPKCVVEAEYLINVPLLKQHRINHRVTLSGKNIFGTFIEEVIEIDPYHQSGQIIGNPAPQTDLLASDELGGKTLLYIGDGLYGTLNDHRAIYRFQMYPFNDDWTNSLFFSQDPVAIDSVMYDFLHTEGPIPIEGSQNYIHQAAEPDSNTYDPEGDGTYVSESIGVHEHWDVNVDIFLSDRYSGVDGNGIDFVAIGEEHSSTSVIITKPEENKLYIFDQEKTLTILNKRYYLFPITIAIGPITVTSELSSEENVEHMAFFVDGDLKSTDDEYPYTWSWNAPSLKQHQLSIWAMIDGEYKYSAERIVLKLL
jgi:hypothetical protein